MIPSSTSSTFNSIALQFRNKHRLSSLMATESIATLDVSRKITLAVNWQRNFMEMPIIRKRCVLLLVRRVIISSAELNITENAGLDQRSQHCKLTREIAIILARAMSIRSVVAMALVQEPESPTSRCSPIARSLMGIQRVLRTQQHLAIHPVPSRILGSWDILALVATLKAPMEELCQMERRWPMTL
jgi:hypothetical protein